MRRLAAVAAVAVAGATLAGCREATVRLESSPAPGTRAAYRIEVRAVTVTALAERVPRRTVTETVFDSSQEVLEAGPAGTRARVRIQERDGPQTTFVVRLDRAGQLAEVQTVEGLPADALGDLGLSEIFPAAAAAPPPGPLEPGARWAIDEPVQVGGGTPSRLTGTGRLVELGTVDGRKTATVESTYRLPVDRSELETEGRLRLSGAQDTTARVTYGLADGAVESVRARTRGSYRVSLFPPPGTAGEPVAGTLEVEVSSRSQRVGAG